jgi:pyruvate dehydrogenase E2 component (dihydrolipoamide acetyltransferase)
LWFQYTYTDLPEHKEIRLPALSPTMSTGTIVSWEKNEGDEIMDGDVLAQVETDKATMDMDSATEGYMAKIVVPAGTKDIPLGKVSSQNKNLVNSSLILYL